MKTNRILSMRAIRLAGFSAAILLLSACGGDSESEPSFLPLQVGHEWTFTVEGAVENNYTSISVREQFNVGGTAWFGVEPLLGEFALIRNTPRGVVHSMDCSPYDFAECLDEVGSPDEQLLYKYPASRGEQYGILDWPDTAVTVLGEQQLTVPAGTFGCMLYEFNFGEEIIQHCVAPGVGLIWAQETWSTRDGQIPVILKRSRI